MPSPKTEKRGGDVDPLTRLAIKHGTDKWGQHFYSPIYHSLFSHLCDQPVRLLEIGVGGYGFKKIGGASLRMWAEYFPSGRILGIDVAEKQLTLDPRITVLQGSQVDTAFLARLGADHGPFDIIIDDGSHVPAHVVTSFDALFPHLADDGVYVIEDVQTSFWSQYGGSVLHGGATIGLARSILEYLNHAEISIADSGRFMPAIAKQIRSLRAYHNILVIEKGDNTAPSNAAYLPDNAIAEYALATIERELAHTPTPEGIANLVQLYSLGGRHAKAKVSVEEGLAKWPDNPALLLAALGVAHRHQDVQQRLRHVEDLLRLEPDNAPLQAELAKARGEGTPVPVELGEAGVARGNVPDQLEHATGHHKAGRLAEAEALYAAVLVAEPENFDALNRLGILNYQRGRLDEAHRLLMAAIARNPRSHAALANLASVLLALKRFNEALETCDRALALEPDEPDILYNRGHVLVELKRYDEALACYDRVLSLRPDDPHASDARGKALVLLKHA